MVDEVVADATEEWRPVVGYEGRYEVSSLGRVRGLVPYNGYKPLRILKAMIHPQGYWMLNLHKNGKQKTFRIHNLVARCFIGPQLPGIHVNHKDGRKANNSLSNLEYVSAKENNDHAIRLGLNQSATERGRKRSKLTEMDVIGIKAVAVMYPVGQIGRMYGVSKFVIACILAGKSWKHVH